jgi:PPOX class probable FMN-dependent enzyme
MIIQDLDQLAAIYDAPITPASTVKEVARITPHYRRLIEASPFVALASVGPEGLDCSPRGDAPGFVRVLDETTLALPDRRGNNRIDSLSNVICDPRVALLFLIPGSGTTFRVNGRALISTNPELLASFEVDGKPPRTVLLITVETAYFQCARAIVRSHLWDADRQVDPKSLPTPGEILAAISAGEVGGAAYDAEWPGRAAKSLW